MNKIRENQDMTLCLEVQSLVNQKEYLEKAFQVVTNEELDNYPTKYGITEVSLGNYIHHIVNKALASELCQDVYDCKQIGDNNYFNFLAIVFSITIMRESNLIKNFCESGENHELDSNDDQKLIRALEEALNVIEPEPTAFVVTLRNFYENFLFNEELPFNFVKDFDLERETIFGWKKDKYGYDQMTEDTRFTAIEILYLFVLRATYVNIRTYYNTSEEFENMYFITADGRFFRSLHVHLEQYLKLIKKLFYIELAVLAHPYKPYDMFDRKIFSNS